MRRAWKKLNPELIIESESKPKIEPKLKPEIEVKAEQIVDEIKEVEEVKEIVEKEENNGEEIEAQIENKEKDEQSKN